MNILIFMKNVIFLIQEAVVTECLKFKFENGTVVAVARETTH